MTKEEREIANLEDEVAKLKKVNEEKEQDKAELRMIIEERNRRIEQLEQQGVCPVENVSFELDECQHRVDVLEKAIINTFIKNSYLEDDYE